MTNSRGQSCSGARWKVTAHDCDPFSRGLEPFTFEIDCPEQQDNRHIKHKSAGKDERCDSFEHANRRDIAVK
jgi:hypothetical protein